MIKITSPFKLPSFVAWQYRNPRLFDWLVSGTSGFLLGFIYQYSVLAAIYCEPKTQNDAIKGLQ
ncbi:hypothetical protein ROZALSC1DRAFT_27146 [Rozella allomycis CSF55]|uniref:Uncharacterized protein n=1 Tax=Rozella allomycis (strain CSF55) TaxID=988480 RepID=A0A075ATU0_ROZAC|nr:hypothetical protein O9G_000487 [Rozella allomycis CSF55]RKP21446.1 hypothetical protein ROZALSC1DRAFT_27146 [Rozella allomycis CSF55]|eukprot:EPZ33711.1 hypothetical protein O9G_000487 [Rozella allomycis CSF55]